MLTITKGTDTCTCTSLEVDVEWDEVDFNVVSLVCLLIDLYQLTQITYLQFANNNILHVLIIMWYCILFY